MNIEDLIAYETKMMVFISLNDLGPQYMYEMFAKNSQVTERSLRNTTPELRVPLGKSAIGQKSFSYRQSSPELVGTSMAKSSWRSMLFLFYY